MRFTRRAAGFSFAVAFAALNVLAQDSADLDVVHRIKAEAFTKGKVVEHLSVLTDRFGPRLTASPEYDAAARWILGRAQEWGLANPRLEKWGPFGRSWSLKRFSAHLVEPQYGPLIGFPLAWSESTKGTVRAEPVYVPIRRGNIEQLKAEIERVKREYAGRLKGKIVMLSRLRQLNLQLQPPAKRHSDAELSTEATAVAPTIPPRPFDYSVLREPEEPEERGAFFRLAPRPFWDALEERYEELQRELHAFLRTEGAVAIFTAGLRSDGGTVFGGAAGSWKSRYQRPVTTVSLTPEHYNRIVRLLDQKTPVAIDIEVSAESSSSDVEAANVVAEITGGAKPGEVVIVGAHLDSWTGGTGATDNAAGCAVVMEAMRILKTLGLKLDRSVRMVLWSGEEQGLFGSKAYVETHFGHPKTMQLKPDHSRVSAYFNLDNGSGKIRGIYLQGNDAARPVFERWFAPLRDQGVTTISIRDTRFTDHESFDAVGIPAFQFIQDPLEYTTRTHHSNMDVFDHAQGADLMQASAVLASVIYHAANRAELLPRKPLPAPEPAWSPAPQASGSGAAGAR
jgi:hypothetical protein